MIIEFPVMDQPDGGQAVYSGVLFHNVVSGIINVGFFLNQALVQASSIRCVAHLYHSNAIHRWRRVLHPLSANDQDY